ncbi:MAG: hypothetical protein NTU73_10085 [Ignavibacteriae bacterium]|nr:hypothetical protein [Ignavibacteriota bacterium]
MKIEIQKANINSVEMEDGIITKADWETIASGTDYKNVMIEFITYLCDLRFSNDDYYRIKEKGKVVKMKHISEFARSW